MQKYTKDMQKTKYKQTAKTTTKHIKTRKATQIQQINKTQQKQTTKNHKEQQQNNNNKEQTKKRTTNNKKATTDNKQ